VLDAEIPLGSVIVVEEALRGGGAAALYAAAESCGTAECGGGWRVFAAGVGAAVGGASAVKVASVDGYYAGRDGPLSGVQLRM